MIKIGDILENGVVVIDSKYKTNKDQYILCLRLNKIEYVSWLVGESNSFYHGHYCGDLTSAVSDFNKRINS
jgi:hypothetical protein